MKPSPLRELKKGTKTNVHEIVNKSAEVCMVRVRRTPSDNKIQCEATKTTRQKFEFITNNTPIN